MKIKFFATNLYLEQETWHGPEARLWRCTECSMKYRLVPTKMLQLEHQLQWDHHLIKFTMLHSDSRRSTLLLHWSNRQVKWVCSTYPHSCIFQIIDSGIHFCNSPKIVGLLLVYHLSGFPPGPHSWATVMSWIPSNYCQFRMDGLIPLNSGHILIPVHRHTYKCPLVPLKMAWKNIYNIYLLQHCRFFFLRGTSLTFSQGTLLVTWLQSRNWV